MKRLYELLLAALLVSWARLELRLRGSSLLPALLRVPEPLPAGTARRDPASIARAFQAMARLPWSRCLDRSVALTRTLRRAGHPARCVLGVRRDLDGRYLAHAWVDLDGQVIGERETHSHPFRTLAPMRSETR